MTSPAGDKIASIVESYIGCSLDNRVDELALLVARGVDDPPQMVKVTSNCGTFALGIYHQAGVAHHLLRTPYATGMAIAWLLTIGQDLKALIQGTHTKGLPRGTLLHFGTPGKNDDHVEFMLSEPDADGSYRHAGGGRERNGIGEGVSNLDTSMGRPLKHYILPDKLLPNVVAVEVYAHALVYSLGQSAWLDHPTLPSVYLAKEDPSIMASRALPNDFVGWLAVTVFDMYSKTWGTYQVRRIQ